MRSECSVLGLPICGLLFVGYNRVLDWFKATFPRFYDAPEFNDRNEIIVKPHDYPSTDTVVELVAMDA